MSTILIKLISIFSNHMLVIWIGMYVNGNISEEHAAFIVRINPTSTLKMEAASSTETSAFTYQTPLTAAAKTSNPTSLIDFRFTDM
jgi:hypothetical protein